MKKTLKIVGISLAALLAVVIIAISIVCYIVFTPEKLTPIVKEQAGKYLTCNTELDTVDLTFFSTFPDFALRISNLTLSDTLSSDTILHVNTLTASINLMSFLFKNNIVVNGLELTDGIADIYVDSLGNANYNIVAMGDTADTDTTESSSSLFDLMIQNVRINNLTAAYRDDMSGMYAEVKGLNVSLDGNMQSVNADVDVSVEASDVVFDMNDSIAMSANLSDFNIATDLTMRDNHIEGDIAMSVPSVFFCYE